MGYVPIACHICEGPLDFPSYQLNDPPSDPDDCDLPKAIRDMPDNFRWLSAAVGITEGSSAFSSTGRARPEGLVDNQPISLSDWDELGGFDTQEPPGHYFSPFDGDGKLVGLSCHHACLMLLLDHFKYKLKLSDAQPLQAGLQWHAHLMGVDYGGMLQYQDQFFPYEQLADDGNLWMIEDPAGCERNAQRILDAWRPFAEPVVEGVKNRERRLRNGPCTALLCSFKRASLHAAAAESVPSQPAEVLRLHEAMAALPSEIVTLIVKLADLAYTKEMADASV